MITKLTLIASFAGFGLILGCGSNIDDRGKSLTGELTNAVSVQALQKWADEQISLYINGGLTRPMDAPLEKLKNRPRAIKFISESASTNTYVFLEYENGLLMEGFLIGRSNSIPRQGKVLKKVAEGLFYVFDTN